MRSADVARVLMSERSRRLLLLFATGPRSIAQVATISGAPIGKVHYHVRRFLDLKLLSIAFEQKRAGRAIKFYTAVAREFRIPAEFIPTPHLEDLSGELREALEESRAVADVEEVVIEAGEDGQPLIRSGRPAARNVAAFESWQILRLPEDVAMALAEDLRAVLSRYEARSGAGNEFLVYSAIAPRKQGRDPK